MPSDDSPKTPKDDTANPSMTVPTDTGSFAQGSQVQNDFPTQTSPGIPSSLPSNISTNDPSQDSVPTNPPNSATEPAIITAPHAPKKYGGGKVIATIFGILLLIGGVTAGVILVQRQQQIAEKATSGAECQQNPNCILLENRGNSGTESFPRNIRAVQITSQEVRTYQPGLTEDGCYRVNIEGRNLTWQKYGEGPNCKDISNIQVKLEVDGQPSNTPTQPQVSEPPQEPTSPPEEPPPSGTSASCGEVKAYDTAWNLLSQAQLSALDSGSKVRFAVSGTASSGSFDKAKFIVNGTDLGETSLKKPSTEEFYSEYTIPTNVTSFTVGAQVHHSELGWF